MNSQLTFPKLPINGSFVHPEAGAEPRWYAVYTRYRHEKAVHDELLSKNVETFLPLREVMSRWKDRIQRVHVPLFPGYVFVHADVRRRKLDIVKVPGVARIVGFNSYPEPIPDHEMEAIRVFLNTTIRYDPYPYLTVGKPVEIQRGPLQGLQGIVVRRKGRFKFILSVHLIRQSVALEIDACEIESRV